MPFRAPQAIALAGAFAWGTASKAARTVDVAVQVPAKCLFHKDHLGHRWHGKRALYLVALAQRLQRHKVFKQQEWGLLDSDLRWAACLC